jgi:hypothetical protein
MMKAYQIRLYEFNDRGVSVLERQVIALLTPAQRNELEYWCATARNTLSRPRHATIVPYDLHNFETVKTALSIDAHDLVADAFWPDAPQGRISTQELALAEARLTTLRKAKAADAAGALDDYLGERIRHEKSEIRRLKGEAFGLSARDIDASESCSHCAIRGCEGQCPDALMARKRENQRKKRRKP